MAKDFKKLGIKTISDREKEEEKRAKNQPSQLYRAMLAEALADTANYARMGQQQTQEVANTVTGNAMTALARGDLNNYDWSTSRKSILSKAEAAKGLSSTGIFNSPEYALNGQYSGLPELPYMKQLLEQKQMELAGSMVQDDFAKASKERTAETESQWQQLFRDKDTGNEAAQWYNYLLADYLLGDRAELFDFEKINAQYEALDDAAYYAEEDRLRNQFENLDWETLTGSRTNRYESQTAGLQSDVDMLTQTIGKRETVYNLEEAAKADPRFNEMSSYTGSGLVMGENERLMHSDPYFFINNAGVDEQTFNQATWGTRINWATRDVEQYHSPYLDLGYQYLTDDEMAVYNYYYNTDQQKAGEYLSALQSELLNRRATGEQTFWETLATNKGTGWLATLSSLGMNILNLNQSVLQGVNAAMGNDDPNADYYKYLRASGYITGAQSEAIGEMGGPELFGKTLGQHLYEGGMSGANNLARLALFGPTGALAAAGVQSASSSLHETAGREDMSGAAKVTQAVLTGLAEVGTEKIGLDALFDKGKKNAAKYLMGVIASELGEETVNVIGQAAIEQAVAATFGHGADDMTVQEWIQELGQTGLQTLVSSLLMGSGGAISTAATNRAAGKAVSNEGDVNALLEVAGEMDSTTQSYQLAQELKERKEKGKKLPLSMLGELTQQLEADLGEEQSRVVNQVMDEAIAERLVELGTDEATAKKNAPAVRKVARGQDPSAIERAAVRWDDNASQVVKELALKESTEQKRVTVEGAPVAEPEGQRAGQKWKSEMAVKAITATGEVAGKQLKVRDALETKVEKDVQTAVDNAAKKTSARNAKGKNQLHKAVAYATEGGEVKGEFQRFEMKDGQVQVVVKSGDKETAVKVEDLTDEGGAGTAAIIEYTATAHHNMSADEANTMMTTYQQTGGDVRKFITNFEAVYAAGFADVDAPATSLPAEVTSAVYEQAKAEGAKAETQRVAKAKRLRATVEGSVAWLGQVEDNSAIRGAGDETVLSGALEGMTEEQRTTVEVMQGLAEELKVNVVLYEGKGANLDKLANGRYEPSTHTLYVDVNSGSGSVEGMKAATERHTLGYAMMRTLGHELTHHMESTSAEGYAQYKAAVKKQLQENGQSWAELVRGKIENAAADGRKLTRMGAESEVVADASEYMLQESSFTKKLDSGLYAKVKSFVQSFMEKVREIFTHITGEHRESAALRKVIDGVKQYTGNLQQLWDAALGETIQGGSALGEKAGDVTKTVEELEPVEQFSMRDAYGNEFSMSEMDIEENKRVVANMQPIVRITGNRFAKQDGKDFKTMAIEYFGDEGTTAQSEVLGPVAIDKAGIEHLISSLTWRRSALLPAIKPVIENGRIIQVEKNHKGYGFDTALIAGVVNLDGRDYYMGVAVRERNDGSNGYYIHDAVMVEKRSPLPNKSGLVTAGEKAPTLAIILADLANYNTQFAEEEQFSSRDLIDGETAAEAYEKYRKASMHLNDIRSKQRALNDSDEMKAVYKLMESDAAAGAEAYKNLLDLHGLNVNTSELQKQERALYRRWEELRDRELAEEEVAEIEKSGKTEAEYRRDKAVKEFGYTPYFYDAGYIVPNGKMLNFSGEKNRHFGSLGQDHRAVSTVYANKTGSEAMVAFMHGGNIRIMPESPGLDIASSVEPTAQQYATIRKFVREYGEDEYLNIDFTNENGNVVANLEYEGRIYPDRVVNDIKHYFETGEIREQGISAFMYSTRDLPDTVSIREYLGAMKPTSRMTETEKDLLGRYQKKLAEMQDKERLAAEQDKIIKTAPATSQELMQAKNRYQVYRQQANRIARELARLERAEGFAGIMATSQTIVNEYLSGATGSVADAQDALETEIKGLTDRLKVIGNTVEGTAQGQRNAFARGLFNQTELNRAAKQLKDSYDSRMSVKAIADRLALAYGEIYANEGAEGAKRFAAAAKELAQDILDSSRYRYRSEILSAIAEEVPTISLTESDLQEIRNAGMTITEYKRGLSPYVKVAEGASDLSSYVTNAESYGGRIRQILGDDTEGNLAMALYNVIQAERASEATATLEGMNESASLGAVMADVVSVNLPMSTSDTTLEYLRKELKKYAGENDQAAQSVDAAIKAAKSATARASAVWQEAVKAQGIARQAVEYYRALEEQRRLIELQEQKEVLTEQLKTDAAKKLGEKASKMRQAYREREQRARAYRQTRDEVNKLRRGIGRKVKRLNTLRIRETDQKHVPQELQHVADLVMQTFTDSSLSKLAFAPQQTASLAHRYRALQELESDMTYYWDDEIGEDIANLQALGEAYTALREREGGVPSTMSLEGVELETEILQGVDAIVSNVLRMIDSANDQFLTQRNETFDAFATQTGEDLIHHDDAKILKGKAGDVQMAVDELLRTGNMTPIYFFEHLKNGRIMEVFDQIRRAQTEYARIIRECQDFVQGAKGKHHYGSWAGDAKLEMKTSQGHQITLSREQAMWVYATAKREKSNALYQTEHLLVGGFQYKDTAGTGEGKFRATDKPHSLDTADIARISEWLTAEQKAYADEVVGFLSTTMADYGNAASMEMFGYKKFLENYYFPFQTAAAQRFQRGDEGASGDNAGTGRVKNSGFTKKLQHKANVALIMDDFTTVAVDHMQKMATYAAMVQPIENMKRLMNHKVMEEDGTINTIRALIGQKYGMPAQKYLQDFLKDLNGAAQGDNRATKGVDFFISAFKRGAVMASASVVLQQPTAMARAMAMVNPKYFATNPFYRPGKGVWDEMMKHSGTAVIKDMGKFDVGLGLTASEYISDEHLKPWEAYRRLKAESKLKGGTEAYKRFMDWLTAAPGKADQWTWGLIWQAVKKEVAAQNPGMDTGSEAFLDLVGQRFDDVIDHTQVYDSVLTRSNLMRSKNALHKMATSFMSEPTLSINMLYDAFTGWKDKKYTVQQRGAIFGSVMASQVLAGALAALVQAWNDDKDERNWLEKYADRAAGNILDNINVFGMVPYISDFISLCQGYEVERADMSVVSTLIKYTTGFWNKLSNGETLTLKDWENFAGNWANLTGVPAKNIMREIRRTLNAATNTDWSAPNMTNVGYAMKENLGVFYNSKNSAYYERLAKAMLDGDAELVEDLRTYMLTSKMVTEETIDSGVKTALQNLYADGQLDAEEAKRFLADNGLTEDEHAAYWEVDKWEWMRETGGKAGDWRKYDDFTTAVESGENLKQVIQIYLDNGVTAKTLAAKITEEYKPRMKELYKNNRTEYANLQARILTAYQVLGYDRDKKLKDIQSWLED